MTEVFAFECFPKEHPEFARKVNSTSASKARYEYWLDLSEAWPDYKLINVRCRKAGPPHSNEMFLHVAKMRGLPHVRCGERVKVGKSEGVIIGAGGGANFEILFDSGPYDGNRFIVHPASIQFLEKK